MDMDKDLAIKALQKMDEILLEEGFSKVTLIVGGGGSMVLAHGFRGLTGDLDAIPLNLEFDDIKSAMTKVAIQLKLKPDWINPYFSAYTIYLPPDSNSRMSSEFAGKVLTVQCLGAEDIMIMKLMAGRAKDVNHIKHLLNTVKGLNLSLVDDRLHELLKLYPELAKRAIERLDDFAEDYE